MHYGKLDLVRGIAASAVCLGHLRPALFIDNVRQPVAGLVGKAFYVVTGFGHQAVMVFFVLSGFLIAGSVHERFADGRWSFRTYLFQRLTRLWVVLIPALVFTVLFDLIGRHLTDGPGYDGAYYKFFHSGPSPAQPTDNSITTLLGNLAFLQTIFVPCYGTNFPLWSLANEFWYYVMFPLCLVVMWPAQAHLHRIGAAAIVAGLVWMLPGGMIAAGAIWLMGYGAYFVVRHERARRFIQSPFWFWPAVVALCGFLGLVRFREIPLGDYGVGLLFACVVPGLVADDESRRWWRAPARYLGGLSYTLYVSHFPLVIFIGIAIQEGRQWSVEMSSTIGFALIAVLVFAWAHANWWLFERNTDRIRVWLRHSRICDRITPNLRRPIGDKPTL